MPESGLEVIQVLNSSYGYTGQIGYRAQYVKQALDALNIRNICLARDRGKYNEGVLQVLPLGQVIPRALNAFRLFINPKFNNRKYDAPLFDLFAKPKLEQYLSRETNNVLVAHFWEYAPKLILMVKKEGAKVVLDVPIATSREALRLQAAGLNMDTPVVGINQREENAIQLADLILAPSSYVKSVLIDGDVEEDRIMVNPFGCTITLPEKDYKKKTSLTYIFVGTLSLRKGLHHLLRAWSEGGFENDRLVLCGRVTKGARKLLTQYAFTNIQVPGHVDVQHYLAKADVFVLPTMMEGSSKAVYEAMAAGLPVITTPSSGTVAQHAQEGLIVPVADVAALHGAMMQFKLQPGLVAQYGRAAREKARYYSWERYAQGVVGAYKQVLTS